MRSALAVCGVVVCFLTPAWAQVTFNDLGSYCTAASEVSSPTLVMRAQGLPKSQAEALMSGMTDPVAIRMVKEVIEFAYSRPANISVDQLRGELRNLCLARKIFAQ